MKKIFTLLTAALVTLTSFADHNDGIITITQLSKKNVWVEVDGHRYQEHDRELVIRDLRPGPHTIQVYVSGGKSDWRNIFDRSGRKQFLYNSSVFIRPRQHIDIVINRFSKVFVDERMMDDREEDGDYEKDRDRNHDRSGDRDNNYDNTRGAMDARSFDMLKKALIRETFEKSRLDIAKQTIDRNNFSTMQVRELALLFAFENNKLELAKYAYGNTTDRNNYFQLYDVFSFSNSKEELAEYIRRFR